MGRRGDELWVQDLLRHSRSFCGLQIVIDRAAFAASSTQSIPTRAFLGEIGVVVWGGLPISYLVWLNPRTVNTVDFVCVCASSLGDNTGGSVREARSVAGCRYWNFRRSFRRRHDLA